MKNRPCLFVSFLLILFVSELHAQQKISTPDLSKVKDKKTWTIYNRSITFRDGVVHLDDKDDDGLLYLKDLSFSNGRIELDIKGKNDPGRSFVGLAFHGLDNEVYDAVYFRPFNFKNPERNTRSVQYVSHPTYTWNKLREEHPDVYENKLTTVPDPEEWFHVTILIKYPEVKVYVNNESKASLTVTQLSDRKKGWIGFWVGNGLEGFFKNLKITPD